MVPDFSADPAPGNSEFLKASLNVVVAEERALDDPELLTHTTMAEFGLYPHRAQADRGSSNIPRGPNS